MQTVASVKVQGVKFEALEEINKLYKPVARKSKGKIKIRNVIKIFIFRMQKLYL